VAASLPELVILELHASSRNPGGNCWRNGETIRARLILPIFVITGADLTPEQEKSLRTRSEGFFLKQDDWQRSLIKQLDRSLEFRRREPA